MKTKPQPCLDEIMPIFPLERAPVRISRLALGCAPLGNLYHPISDKQAVDLIHYALNKNVVLFDTAPRYGMSELRLGLALRNIPRQRFTLSTKVGWSLTPEGRFRPDFSREGILRGIEASLGRLGLDRIDIVHLHDPDWNYKQALNEAFPALSELREQGAIGAVSVGMNQWEMLSDFAHNADFDCFLLAGRYTLLRQESLAFLDLCREKHITILLGGVYNSGILATGAVEEAKFDYHAAPLEIMERVRSLQLICDSYRVPLRALALQFPLAHPAVASLVVGAETSQEFNQTFEGLCWEIPPELWQDLRTRGLINEASPLPL